MNRFRIVEEKEDEDDKVLAEEETLSECLEELAIEFYEKGKLLKSEFDIQRKIDEKRDELGELKLQVITYNTHDVSENWLKESFEEFERDRK